MGKVVLEITMSLDGFIAGPNISTKLPLGEGGARLHHWLFKSESAVDAQVISETMESTGAVILGNRTYADAIDDAWGGVSPFQVTAFVLANEVPQTVSTGSSFVFVSDGIESALLQAQAVARSKNVWIMGGANVIQQYLKSGFIDELQIHIAPVLLGEGTRLFEHIGRKHIELESTRVLGSTEAIHLTYRVIKNL